MTTKLFLLVFVGTFSLASFGAGNAVVAPQTSVVCQKDMGFEAWLGGVFREAKAQGISAETLEAAQSEMVFDAKIIDHDHSQSVFQKSFLKFSDDTVSSNRISRAQRLMKTYKDLFTRIENEFGVPAPVLVSFWGLETDFGADMGRSAVMTAVTTLAYDCRRAPWFRTQLFDLLRVIERGDQTPGEMFGDWAGELGGMQITPSDYFNYGVDYDHDGKRDVVHSIPDTMATAANFLMHLGWQKGQPWLQEVKVPENMAWEEADLNIQHSRSQWAKWGVTAANGALVNDELPASLLLPMGRLGPAFLAYPNFKAYLGWNSAMVYSTTAAYMATRIAGAPAVSRGGPVQVLNRKEMLELQRLLVKHGYDLGTLDGKLGSTTRAAIKKAQLQVGLPADSYPSLELINLLK